MQGSAGFNLIGHGLCGFCVHGSASDQAVQKVGAAILEVGAQGLIGHSGQVVPEELAGDCGEVQHSLCHGEGPGIGILEIGLVLIAQRPQEERGIHLAGAGVGRAEGGGGSPVRNAPDRQPGYVGRGGVADVGEAVGQGTVGVSGLGLVLCAKETDQHNGGFRAGGGTVQRESGRVALHHPNGGQVLGGVFIAGRGHLDAK